VNVVEDEADDTSRWFARYDKKTGDETFSARLDKNGRLEMSWVETAALPQLVDNIREIQGAVGQNIKQISGNASDGLLRSIEAGRFNHKLYEKTLARRLGGKWKVETVRRTSGQQGWDIKATRVED
jgi:hypothetical protein